MSARFLLKGADELITVLQRLEKSGVRKALNEWGKGTAKIVKPEMAAATRRRTGGLIKSYAHKLKWNAARRTMSVIVGPRTKFVMRRVAGQKRSKRLAAKEFTREGRGRQWRWQKQKGDYRPSRTAHLAGPGRKSTVVPVTMRRVQSRVLAEAQRFLQQMIATARSG